MARKLRMEFGGACYHIINRGNYRAYIFESEGAKKAFESCLFEACQKSGWILHAYVLMGNHYHIALETPQANLSIGMQWLQSTFANRFNALRGERGHLFQGRYKALLVEPGKSLGQVCHYIHLNPVRAGLCDVETLRDYRYSSYWYLKHKEKRPDFMRMEVALMEAGQLSDTASGWRSYAEYLSWLKEDEPGNKEKLFARMNEGWALGSQEFKETLIKQYMAETPEVSQREMEGEARELYWVQLIDRLLKQSGYGREKLKEGAKSAEWKLRLASWMKNHTQVGNKWLSEHLNMGSPATMSHNLTSYRRKHGKNE